MESQIDPNISIAMAFLLIVSFFLFAYSMYYRMMFLHEKNKNMGAIKAHSSMVGLGLYLIKLINEERTQFNDILRILVNEVQPGGDIRTATTSIGVWLAEKNIPMKAEPKQKINHKKFAEALHRNEKELSKHLNN